MHSPKNKLFYIWSLVTTLLAEQKYLALVFRSVEENAIIKVTEEVYYKYV